MKVINLGKHFKLKSVHVLLMILSLSFLILAYCMYEMAICEPFWNNINTNRKQIGANRKQIGANIKQIGANRKQIGANIKQIGANRNNTYLNQKYIKLNARENYKVNDKIFNVSKRLSGLENNYVSKQKMNNDLNDFRTKLKGQLYNDIKEQIQNDMDTTMTMLDKANIQDNMDESKL